VPQACYGDHYGTNGEGMMLIEGTARFEAKLGRIAKATPKPSK
jgi:hypothetical protein